MSIRAEQFRALSNLSKDEAEAQIHKLTQSKATIDSSTTGQIFKTNLKNGIKFLGHGIADTFKGVKLAGKGIGEVVLGTANEIDTLALGLGGLAILTIGELTIPLLWAVLSNKRLQGSDGTAMEVFNWSNNPRIARAVGYPLLAIAGGYGAWQIEKVLNQ